MTRKQSRLLVLFLLIAGCPCALAAPSAYAPDTATSTVTFDAKSTFHGFSGTTHDLKGRMSLDEVPGKLAVEAELAIPVMSLKTGIPSRDHAMQHMFQAEQYPEISFRILNVTPMEKPASDSASGRNYEIHGLLKIRQIEREIISEAMVFFDSENKNRLRVKGALSLETNWFKLEPPVVFGFIRVDPHISLTYDIVWKRQ